MEANLTREGRDVGVFAMTRDGEYAWDCFENVRERFEDAIRTIIEDLREPKPSVGPVGSVPRPVIYKPGDPRWFDRVLARLQNKGYEHSVTDAN